MDNITAKHVLHHCDRTRSAEARHSLQSELWTPLLSHGIHLTSSCILAPANDVLLLQELSKTRLNSQLWQCSLCAKIFRSEHFLDRHLSRRHPDLRSPSASVCLADLCSSIVPCLPTKTSSDGPVSTALLSASDSSSVKSRSHKLQHSPTFCHDLAVQRRLVRACEHVLSDCLHSATHSETTVSLQKHFVQLSRRLCDRVVEVECTSRTSAPHLLSNRITHSQNSVFPVFLVFLSVAVAVAFTFARLVVLHDKLRSSFVKIVRRCPSSGLQRNSESKQAQSRMKLK